MVLCFLFCFVLFVSVYWLRRQLKAVREAKQRQEERDKVERDKRAIAEAKVGKRGRGRGGGRACGGKCIWPMNERIDSILCLCLFLCVCFKQAAAEAREQYQAKAAEREAGDCSSSFIVIIIF